MKSAKKFNLELALVNFPKFVRQGEDLLKAKLVSNYLTHFFSVLLCFLLLFSIFYPVLIVHAI
jgi:hypothetical protein